MTGSIFPNAKTSARAIATTFFATAALALAMLTSPALATDVKTFTKNAAIDDVVVDVESAIIDKGLVIDFKGNVGGMLKRTGSDVGAKGDLYAGAYYFTFCSAVLSRKMMEADPANMGLCPYVVFAYENTSKPGEVFVGYRSVGQRGNDASKAALQEVDAMLEEIVKTALE